jgi:hypothetical protein
MHRPDANHRKVGIRIVADDVALERLPIGKMHRQAAAVVDDVTVGEDQAVRREHEPRPRSLATAPTPPPLRPAASPRHIDLHHRRRDAFDRTHDRRRIRIQQLAIARCIDGMFCLYD